MSEFTEKLRARFLESPTPGPEPKVESWMEGSRICSRVEWSRIPMMVYRATTKSVMTATFYEQGRRLLPAAVESVCVRRHYNAPTECNGRLPFGEPGNMVGERVQVVIRADDEFFIAGHAVFTRIQPNDGDGPGFTDFVVYEW
jgi:hypothetical protein